MDLQQAAAVAKQHVGELFAAAGLRNIRLEGFLYDDHLMVWTLTIGFTLADAERSYKIIRVSETNKSVLSIQDR